MTRHILRGHYPYDPNCIECAQGRGVGRSPRRPRRERILEIQADFFFLGRVSDKYKFILLRQVLSGLLGTTAVGPNVNVTAQQIRQILVEFGVSGSDGPPIDIRTDAATDVGELLRRSAINREFTLSRAGPRFCRTRCEGSQGSYRCWCGLSWQSISWTSWIRWSAGTAFVVMSLLCTTFMVRSLARHPESCFVIPQLQRRIQFLPCFVVKF